MWTHLGSLDVHDKKFVQLVYISTLVVASKLSSNAVGESIGEQKEQIPNSLENQNCTQDISFRLDAV